MTLRAAQTDECFRQRERLPFAKEPVERNARKALIWSANGLFCVRRVFVCARGRGPSGAFFQSIHIVRRRSNMTEPKDRKSFLDKDYTRRQFLKL